MMKLLGIISGLFLCFTIQVHSQERPKEYLYAIVIHDDNPTDSIKSRIYFIENTKEPIEVIMNESYNKFDSQLANSSVELILLFNSHVMNYTDEGWQLISSVTQSKNVTLHIFEKY